LQQGELAQALEDNRLTRADAAKAQEAAEKAAQNSRIANNQARHTEAENVSQNKNKFYHK
jgi:hypothetical protein